MSRTDPGAATGQPIPDDYQSDECACADSVYVHKLTGGRRGRCSHSACGCREFRPSWRRDACGVCVLIPTVAGERQVVDRLCPEHGS